MAICEWCGSNQISAEENTVYWELPDGTRAIHITETPCEHCLDCGMTYQTEDTTKRIEDQLFLINTKEIGRSLSYQELMAKERLLKRNYFDFSS